MLGTTRHGRGVMKPSVAETLKFSFSLSHAIATDYCMGDLRTSRGRESVE